MLCFQMNSNSIKPPGFALGMTGIVIGAICLATLYGIEMYGPNSYTTSGSVGIGDGEFYSETSTPLLPQIARVAFYMFIVPLILSAVSFTRRETKLVSWGALVVGLSPLLLYTIGIITTAVVLFIIGLPTFGVLVKRRYAET